MDVHPRAPALQYLETLDEPEEQREMAAMRSIQEPGSRPFPNAAQPLLFANDAIPSHPSFLAQPIAASAASAPKAASARRPMFVQAPP
jgi:hypothetical protein